MKNQILNVKSLTFLFVSVLLIYGVSDHVYGNDCFPGDVIKPGESCRVLGTKTGWFRVFEGGSAWYREGDMQVSYIGKVLDPKMTASEQADGSWLIESIESVESTPMSSAGFCKVGDVIKPGEWCELPGTKFPSFGVQRGFATYFEGDLGAHNTFYGGMPDVKIIASRQADDTWLIEDIPGAVVTQTDASETRTLPTSRQLPTFHQMYWLQRNVSGRGPLGYLQPTERGHGLYRAHLDGSNIQHLLEFGIVGDTTSVIDEVGGKIYWTVSWTDYAPYVTRRWTVDWVKDLPEYYKRENWTPHQIEDKGRIYYARYRANLDGSNAERIMRSGPYPVPTYSASSGYARPPPIHAFALDVVGRKLYWWGTKGKRMRSNLDGSNVETFIFEAGRNDPEWEHFSRLAYLRGQGIVVDEASGKMYGINMETSEIYRANLNDLNIDFLDLDDLNRETLIEPSDRGRAYRLKLSIDEQGGKIYWVERAKHPKRTEIVYRANLDGSNVEAVITKGLSKSNVAFITGAGVQPDLAVESFQPNYSTLVPGESFTFSGIVRNKGEAEASPTTLRYYRSTNEAGSVGGKEVGEGDVPPLASDATSDASVVLTAPTTLGTYYYRACVIGVSGERIINNNCTPSIKVTVKPESDLAFRSFVTNIKTDDNTLAPGASLRLAVIVTNRGEGEASPTTLRYYRSTDEDFTADDTEVGKTDLSSLAVGAIKRHRVLINAPTAPGIYYYGACIDTVGEERITDNNCSRAVKVTVKSKSELVIEPLQPSDSTLALGESFRLSGIVRSTGEEASSATTLRYYRSTDEAFTAADTEVGKTDVPALASDATSDVNVTLTAPAEPGIYYYGACVGSAGNNCSPTVKITVVREPKVLVAAAQRPPLYWIDTQAGTLHRLVGAKIEALVPNVQNATDLAVDIVNDRLYWAEKVDNRTGRIRAANLNGSNVKLVKDLTSVPVDIAVDTAGGKLYLINSWGKVQRMNLDGSKFEPNLIVDLEMPQHLTLDATRGKIYWTEQTGEATGKIRRANLDGSNVELVKALTSAPLGLAADATQRKLYVASSDDKIQQLSFDGSNFRPNFITDIESPGEVAVDAIGGKMYWTEMGRLRRADLNGENVQDIVRELEGLPTGITLGISAAQPTISVPQTEEAAVVIAEVQRPPLYWIDTQSGTLHRLVGTEVENLAPSVQNATSLTVDVAGDKLYWTEKTSDKTGRIRRTNLDGSNVQLVKDLTSVPQGIALDGVGGKIYITNAWGKVQRLNVDGSNFEPNLITGLDMPKRLTLDISIGKVYWTEMSGRIRRANLDGSNIQDVATGSGTPMNIAVSGSNLYWTEQTGEDRGEIHFANLQGNPNVMTLHTFTGGFPVGIAVDTVEDKLYWTTSQGEIGSANLDGSDFRPNLVTGLTAPGTVAVAVKPKEVLTTDAVLSISPLPVTSPTIGERLTLKLSIAGGEAVAGYQVIVEFDTTALRYVESRTGDYLPDASFEPPVVKENRVELASTTVTGVGRGDGTLATVTFEVLAVKASTLTLSETLLSDDQGNTFRPRVEEGEITEPRKQKEDVNDDGIVNIQDLVLVASGFGKAGENAADVNTDGIVNIQDLVLVAGAFGSGAAAAPVLHLQAIEGFTASEVQHLLSRAREMSLTDPAYLRGIAVLEQLLALLVPKETSLLPNYPNPFNPETWIPYQLAKPTDVTFHIYAANGVLVRTLALGHQSVGIYHSRSRAAYWDGRNESGEKVASGIYFYTLSADDFTATRKMLIMK